MPYNGTGVFNRIYQWVQDAANGIFVDATRTDTDSNDIAAGLTNCVTRDGQSPWLANIPAGGFKITGLANGVTTTDSVNYQQVFNNPSFVTPNATTSPATSDNSLRLATTAFVQQVAFSAALPAQSLGFLASNGTTAAFTRTFSGYAVDESKGANVASAATIDLQNTVVTGNLVHVTGTTPITAITLPAGAERTIVFDGILTLTHSASLDLPGAANITTAVGDRAIVRGEGSGVTRIISYNKANGAAVTVTAPALVLIAGPLTPSAAANVDFLNTFSSTYDDYEIQINAVNTNGTSTLGFRFAIAGSADSGANYSECPLDNSAGGSTGLTYIDLGAPGIANQPRTATVRISGVNTATSNVKTVWSICNSSNLGGSAPVSQGFIGYHNAANVATGFRLLWPSGTNFTATGSIKVYGISKV